MPGKTAGGVVFDIAGDGEPVVLIHGLGGSSNTWQPQMTALRNFTVLRPDMPGSGRSPVPMEAQSIASFAEAIADGLKELGVSSAHFGGHSLGTLVCQHIAVHMPQRVRSLSLFGALTEPPDGARNGLIGRAATARAGGMDTIADQIVANTLSPSTHRDKPAAVAFVRESVMRQPPEGYAKSCEALSRAQAFLVERIEAPVLLVAGDTDPVAPPSMATALKDRIPNAKMVLLERSGHWIPIEKAEESSRLIAEFLQMQLH
jgi:pimeloyl-ACP methyl ester carboxylesterase